MKTRVVLQSCEIPFSRCAGYSYILKVYSFLNLSANVLFSREREACPSHFSSFSNCPGIVLTHSQSMGSPVPPSMLLELQRWPSP